MKRVAPFVAVGVALVMTLVIWVLATSEPATDRQVDSPLLGQPAPAVAGATLGGEAFDLAEERGSFVVVNFFATWCVPCQREHDDLRLFHERHAPVGDASVVSVVFDDSAGAVAAYFEENGGDWPVLVGDDGDIALDYGILGVPESYLIAPNGLVVAKIIGGVTADGLEGMLDEARQR